MDFKNVSNTELILRTEKLVRTERKIGHLVLLHISEMESRKIFAELGFDSLFSYLTRGLGYSESGAYRRLNSARLLKQIPEIAVKLENGSLNMSQLTSVQKCLKIELKKSFIASSGLPSKSISEFGAGSHSSDSDRSFVSKDSTTSDSTSSAAPIDCSLADSSKLFSSSAAFEYSDSFQSQANQRSAALAKTKAILAKIENKNNFETEQILNSEFQLPTQSRENIKPQRDQSIRIEMTLTAEQFAELEMARNLLSHTCPGGTWADILSILARKFNQSRKAKSNLENTSSSAKQKPLNATSDKKTIPRSVVQNNKIQNSNPDSNLSTQRLSEMAPDLECSRDQGRNSNSKKLRQTISVKNKKTVFALANYQCEYKNKTTGLRCQSKSFLEIDHRRPITLGGTNDINNLRLLCRTHNQLAARNSGIDWK